MNRTVIKNPGFSIKKEWDNQNFLEVGYPKIISALRKTEGAKYIDDYSHTIVSLIIRVMEDTYNEAKTVRDKPVPIGLAIEILNTAESLLDFFENQNKKYLKKKEFDDHCVLYLTKLVREVPPLSDYVRGTNKVYYNYELINLTDDTIELIRHDSSFSQW